MSVTTAKIRAREKATGKKAHIGLDSAGNLHYAFDNATLQSIITKANNILDEQNSAKAVQQAKDLAAYNNDLAMKNTQSANQFNASQAQLNRDFQMEMSNTAHQREVADLKAAGLNPVLSAGGSGASSPSGSTASGSAAPVDMGATSAAVEMAKSAMSAKTELAKASISAKTQLQMNRDNINSAQSINNKSLALQKELGLLGFDNAITQALINQASSKYSADIAAGASKYVADNPNNLTGAIIKSLSGQSYSGSGLFNNAKKVASAIGKKLQHRSKDTSKYHGSVR